MGSRARMLLIGASVYRERADRSALLFQVGVHDWTAACATDGRTAAPPYQPPADLNELITACTDAGLLTCEDTRPAGRAAGGLSAAVTGTVVCTVFVDRQLALELHQLLRTTGRGGELAAAHRQAAAYLQWRAAVRPHVRHTDIHDALEARYHLLAAGDVDEASELTEAICGQLRARGDLGQEAELIEATLEAMPSASAGRARWLHELAGLARLQGDQAGAERLYLQAAEIFGQVGDNSGISRAHECLGLLAHARGDYQKAEHYYRNSARCRAGAAAETFPADHPLDQPERGAQLVLAGPLVQEAPTSARAAAPPAPAAPDPPAPGPAAAPRRPAVAEPAPQRTETQPTRRRSSAGRPSARRGHHLSGRTRRKSPLRWLWRPEILATPLLGMVALATTTIAVAVAGGSGLAASPPDSAIGLAASERVQAADWVGREVSHSAVVACDPAMCAALREQGIPAGDVLVLSPDTPSDPLGSDVVVATAALRSKFGARLASVYAPLVIARFGVGSASIEIRATAPYGAAAYLGSLTQDVLARRLAGAELLENTKLSATAPARAALTRGRVDTRLLSTIAALAAMRRLRIIGFGDSGPGASPRAPFRSVEVAVAAAVRAGALRPMRAFLRAQRAPWLAADIAQGRLANGRPVLRFEFAAPSPLGLLPAASPAPEADVHQ
jgi:hypothetical protein